MRRVWRQEFFGRVRGWTPSSCAKTACPILFSRLPGGSAAMGRGRGLVLACWQCICNCILTLTRGVDLQPLHTTIRQDNTSPAIPNRGPYGTPVCENEVPAPLHPFVFVLRSDPLRSQPSWSYLTWQSTRAYPTQDSTILSVASAARPPHSAPTLPVPTAPPKTRTPFETRHLQPSRYRCPPPLHPRIAQGTAVRACLRARG